MIEELRESRGGYGVHWMRFLKLATSNQEKILCIFEGEDSKYYGWRLDMFLADPWVHVNAGGRANVEKIHALCESSNQHLDRSFFFIDRDFDEDAQFENYPDRMFVTSDYSVENLYVTESAMSRVLRDEFSCIANGEDTDKLLINQECLGRALEHFRACRDAFLQAIMPINAWIVCHRRRKSVDAKLTISNLKITDYVDIRLDTTVAKFDLRALHEEWSKAPLPTEQEMLDANEFLQSRSLLSTCRGKFVAQFLRIYIERLKADAALDSPSVLLNDARPKLSVSDKNFLSDLSQFADTPRRLRDFISAMVLPVKQAA